MAIMNKKILIVLWFFINFTFATVPASINHSDLTFGQSLTLTIDVSHANGNPDLSVLKNNFDVFGTSSSSQTSITNGHINSQKSFIINLSPKNSGKQIIPAIKVGNDLTAPITINVKQQSAQNIAMQKKQIFVDGKVNNSSTYIGVPLIYSLKLYYAVSISNVNITNMNIKEATVELLDKPIQYAEDINGTDYQVYEQKLQITPNQAGNIAIPPINITGISSDNDTGMFFNRSQPKHFNVASKTINVTVKPIPSNISPDQWFPAKQVSINESQSVADTTIKLGQPITRTIVVKAMGVPFTSIPEIKLTTPKNVNAYPDKTVTSNSFSGDDVASSKVFKIAYIPTQAGTIDFPDTTIKWWDITSDSLKTIVIPGKTYTILNENGKVLDASAVAAQQLATLEHTEVKPVQKSTANSKLDKIWFYLTIIFALLWLFTIFISIILLRKKSIIKTDNDAATEKLANEKKALALISSACHDKDIKALNSALVQWASLHWHRKIYTVLDIKDLSANNTLNALIDQFNHTLYRGSTFDKFDALEREINLLANAHQQQQNSKIKELYPK